MGSGSILTFGLAAFVIASAFDPRSALARSYHTLGLSAFHIETCSLWRAMARERHNALLCQLSVTKLGQASMPTSRKRDVTWQIRFLCRPAHARTCIAKLECLKIDAQRRKKAKLPAASASREKKR